mmetsp:Transcript_21523/g.54229  ORF Transcript_21523/g.54229 Transcript_21523/m.54229 type:complete len:198 (-) Transcript_21523:656-1249(-)|eukprot:g17452.t1
MGKKGKKDKKPKAPGLPLQPEELNLDLTWQIETLERDLLVKQRIEEGLRSTTFKQRDRVEQMQEDLKEEKKITYAVTSDMARRYKSLQEDLIHKINTLETTLTEQKEELDMTKHELSELIADKEDIIAHKDQVIAELKNRTEVMCNEFHEMLGSTLRLMKDHMAAKLIQDPENGDRTGKSNQEAYAAKLQDLTATKR